MGNAAGGDLLCQTLLCPEVFWPMLLIFLTNALPPAIDAATMDFLTKDLQLSMEFLSGSELMAWAAMVFGNWSSARCSKKLDYRKMFLIGIIGVCCCGAADLALLSRWTLSLGISDAMFVLTSTAFGTLFQQFGLMTFLTMANKLTPEGNEATVYAAYCSCYNFSGSAASITGAKLLEILGTKPDALITAVMVRTGLQLVPAFLVYHMLPETLALPEKPKSKGFQMQLLVILIVSMVLSGGLSLIRLGVPVMVFRYVLPQLPVAKSLIAHFLSIGVAVAAMVAWMFIDLDGMLIFI
eukprot:gnl/MRDRNA2_/MRDRNA2_233331_c0_seq1.p1 gnl/MRDRNA2_/MRDRNA2_233331_c0~~gnl/MRDRNA2_/MRDRNA2_233331_c0_seq1.p1  ORF type:complete len:296 (+),score=51.38 gnl/MRDRNA2_/MRDRNA2_233331_c0_seq1:38-925(+)